MVDSKTTPLLACYPSPAGPRRRSGGHAGVVLTPRQLAPHVALSGPFACVQTADDCIAAQVLDVDSLGDTPPFVCAAAASIIGPGTYAVRLYYGSARGKCEERSHLPRTV
jgi:hypothetical protein